MKQFLLCAFCALLSSENSETKTNFTGTALFDLVITEVMADPDPPVGLPDQEYCEIYNRSNVPVSLSGWTFFDGSSRNLPSITINPGEYVIICDDGDTALFAPFGKYAAVSSISLTNTGEKISIRDPFGNAIDSVTYTDSWFDNSNKLDGGWSLERVDVNFTCPVSDNWKPSIATAGGSPGTMNSVNGTISDNVSPQLIRSYCPDSSSVILVFDESLEPLQALQLYQYSLSHTLVPVGVTFEDEYLKRIRLTFQPQAVSGIIYTATANNITDCSGNLIPANSKSHFGLSDTLFSNEIIINEILFNPYSNGYDFVELYHRGTGIVDLSKYKMETIDPETGLAEESSTIIDEQYLVFPGEYLVITENPEAVALQYRSSYPKNFLQMENLPSMNIDEGHLVITTPKNLSDAFHYNEDLHFDLIEDVKGISLEKINPSYLSSDPGAWHSAAESAGFATPGLKNSQYSEGGKKDALVSLSPEIFSPDNDGMDDVITISLKPGTQGYISNIWIYNSHGQVIFDSAHNTLLSTNDAFTWDGITSKGEKAPAGIYIAFIEIFHLSGDVKNFRLPFVVAVKL